MIKISDLRNRDVINVLDGKKLGNIMDIDLDLESGRVLSLIMPGQARRFNLFARREEIMVPWQNCQNRAGCNTGGSSSSQ